MVALRLAGLSSFIRANSQTFIYILHIVINLGCDITARFGQGHTLSESSPACDSAMAEQLDGIKSFVRFVIPAHVRSERRRSSRSFLFEF